MPDGGRLVVVTKREAANALILIEDSGAGIAPEDVEAIFQPLFTAKPDSGGTGLGLTIVRQIIEEHHGNISVESERHNGTRFAICLPLIVA